MTVPQSFLELATGLETSLEFFFRWCNTTTECALYGQDQGDVWDGILALADAGNLTVPGCQDTPKLCSDVMSTENFILSAQGKFLYGNPPTPVSGANYCGLFRTGEEAGLGSEWQWNPFQHQFYHSKLFSGL